MSIVDGVLRIGAVTLSLVVGGCGAADEGAHREEAVVSGEAALTSYAASVTGVRVTAGGMVVQLSCAGAGLSRVFVRASSTEDVDGYVESGVAVLRVPPAQFEMLRQVASSVSFVALDVDDDGGVTAFDFAIG